MTLTKHIKVASGPCLAEFHATEAATLLNNQNYSLQNGNQTQTAVMHNVASTSEKEDKKEEDKKEINAMQMIPEKDTVLSENSSHVSESKHKEISNENGAVKAEESIEAPHSLAGAIGASVFEISKKATTPKQEEAPPIKSIFEPVENNVNSHFETMNDGYMGYNGQFQMYSYPKMMADFAIPSDISPSSQPREKRYLTRLEKIDRQVQSYSPRMKARCTFWPNCTNKNCKYWHPVKECR